MASFSVENLLGLRFRGLGFLLSCRMRIYRAGEPQSVWLAAALKYFRRRHEMSKSDDRFELGTRLPHGQRRAKTGRAQLGLCM